MHAFSPYRANFYYCISNYHFKTRIVYECRKTFMPCLLLKVRTEAYGEKECSIEYVLEANKAPWGHASIFRRESLPSTTGISRGYGALGWIS